MSEQRASLISLQKRMLDADMPRRLIAIAGAAVAGLLYFSPALMALYFFSYLLTDLILMGMMIRLVARPDSALRLAAVLVAAFASMSVYVVPSILLWPLPGSVPKIGAMIHLFGGMLSIMLVRAAFMPLTIANSLPVAVAVAIIGWIEVAQTSLPERAFLIFAVFVLGVYFVITLIEAQRINHELARARDAALARVETQRRFLATMSHELRTPLNGILGMAQSMIAQGAEDGAETIRESARDMAAMVDDLLDNAAIEAGALRINRKPVDLASIVARIKDRWDEPFAAKGLQFTLTLAADLPKTVMLDQLRFLQCLSNLLANALRLTREGGVELTLRRHPNGIEAVTTDTGPGLPIGAETRLFQPFETLHPTGQQAGSSNGLGLSITRGLARAMGGDLLFERPLMGGSRFRLTIAAEETSALPAADQPTEMRADLLGKRILLVDDIATNRLVLRLLLSGADAVPIEASSGEQALSILADQSNPAPDAALLDIRMPGLSGFDTLAGMRAMGARFPIVAVSADAAPEEREEALAHGFDGYLTKPVEDAQLRSLLAQVLARAGHL